MTKLEKRQIIYDKYGGRCAYCGEMIEYKAMQVDHIIPRNRYSGKYGCLIQNGKKVDYEMDDLRNLNPTCRICNNWKLTFTLEDFRKEISKQVERARKYSRNFRMAERFGFIKTIDKSVVFYFESF
ncbi:MAG TPA: HNH endonuclease [Nitrospirae bacterium]|nr:HNH endonuclease [Nitrospirota bacterium]